MKIPFTDLNAQYAALEEDLQKAMARVIADKAFIRGPYTEKFETEFAEYCGARHCVGVGNGTDAIYLALKAMEIGPGDEVLVPAMTFVATSEAVTMSGATPVFVDVDPASYTMNPAEAEKKITPKTKAVIPVHLYGHPADMTAIRILADTHGLKIIQDAAQAHGAGIDGMPIAGYGDCQTYSFYPGKNLGAYGDAGAVVTNDDKLAGKVKMLANHGRTSKYDHKFEGINSRMDGLQGAILSVKLNHLKDWTGLRCRWAKLYSQALKGINQITPPAVRDGADHVYHLYVVMANNRDALQKHLSEHDIATGIHYPIALPFLEAYSRMQHVKTDFPVAAAMQEKALSLPMFPELEGKKILQVVDAIKDFYDA
ncbi:DegT/DnrJ/EryC1/StrS family aminotransferase [Salidesulfovibrio onnuriiensis]|uniref:DegT/DnrJ/EryC1/StrS family aminotransferase n=1 Tax=Salidesulfovibrio onnuriiensis TaxID=2583823 RepID=UPI0011CBD2BF|nr:DegT/DnrJ/EryC1/StrS family aminotransferase [Salidesulfovibrio onnuriiensis]